MVAREDGETPAVVTSYGDVAAVVDVVRGLLDAGDVVAELRGPADIGALDALARLALAARGAPGRLTVRAGRDLQALAGFCGLADVLCLDALSGQADGHPEAAEDLRPGEGLRGEEVVDVRDPPV